MLGRKETAESKTAADSCQQSRFISPICSGEKEKNGPWCQLQTSGPWIF